MKRQLLTLSLVMVFSVFAKGQEIVPYPILKKQLDSLEAVDRQVGQAVRDAKPEQRDSLRKIVNGTFVRHTAIVKDIFKKYGFPGADMVGVSGSHGFWICVQHSDHDLKFQDEALKSMEKLVKTKKVNLGSYAFLRDRVNINMGKAQIYGTQVTYDAQNNAVPKKMKDPAKVNQRRKTVELEPIEDYLAFVNEVHKKMNP